MSTLELCLLTAKPLNWTQWIHEWMNEHTKKCEENEEAMLTRFHSDFQFIHGSFLVYTLEFRDWLLLLVSLDKKDNGQREETLFSSVISSGCALESSGRGIGYYGERLGKKQISGVMAQISISEFEDGDAIVRWIWTLNELPTDPHTKIWSQYVSTKHVRFDLPFNESSQSRALSMVPEMVYRSCAENPKKLPKGDPLYWELSASELNCKHYNSNI